MIVFTSLEVQQEPAVAEVEMCVVSILVHQFKQLRVQDLMWTRQDQEDPGQQYIHRA